MKHLIPGQYRNQKTVLVLGAAVLGLVACIVFLQNTYADMQLELEDLEQQLFVNQKQLGKLSGLQQEIKQQKQQIARFDRAMLKGESQDAILSMMQIQVQSLLTDAGLEPESLRPIGARETGGAAIQPVVLKLRLNGTLEQFKLFIAAIYRADSFFQIEGLNIKPFKLDQLKIYMDLTGYYQVSSASGSTMTGGE